MTEGIEAAVSKAKEIAGDRSVAVNGGQMARQALEAGLLEEIGVDLVPVILGEGTPLFAEGDGPEAIEFEGPIRIVEGTGVTHLRYRVVKSSEALLPLRSRARGLRRTSRSPARPRPRRRGARRPRRRGGSAGTGRAALRDP